MTTLVCVKYQHDNPITDFSYLVKQNPKGTLFLYNENFEQYMDVLDTRPGGGNAVLRKYRLDHPQHMDNEYGSLGIPTMSWRYDVRTSPNHYQMLQESILYAFDVINKFLHDHPSYTTVVWSSDAKLSIGMAIAVQTGRISHQQQTELQNLIRYHMQQLIDSHKMNVATYNCGTGTCMTDTDFLHLITKN